MSDVMTWNWHGNASGMPLGRNGNNQVVSYPTGVPIAPDSDPVDNAEDAPDAPPDTPTNPDGQGSYTP